MRAKRFLPGVITALIVAMSATSAGAQSPFDVVVPERVPAGDQADLYVIAPTSAVAVEFDGKDVDVDGFVRQMTATTHAGKGSDPCPTARRCFVTTFAPDVYVTPGTQPVTITTVDAQGRRVSSKVGVRIGAAVDDDADGMPDAWERRYGFNAAGWGQAAQDDPDADGVTNIEEYRRRTNPVGKYARYFAEGSTGDRQPLRTYLTMHLLEHDIRSGGLPSTCQLLAIGDDGRRRQQWTYASSGCQRMSVLGPGAVADRVAMVIAESPFPFVAERQTLSGSELQLVNSSFGMQQASRTWYFADGRTSGGLDMFLLLYNPGTSDVDAEFTYVDGRREVLRRVRRLAPRVRTTVWVNRDDTEAMGSDVAVSIRATDPVFVERAFRHASPGKTVPHDSVTRGTLVPASRWFFPDVDGRGPFESSIAVLNPSATDATLTLTAYFANQDPATRCVDVPAGLRLELSLAELGIPPDTAASIGIRASAAIVAERVTDGGRPARWRRSAAGVTTAGVEWRFANGGAAWAGTAERQGELVLTNVSDTDARVEVWSYVTQPGYMGGSRGYSFEVPVGANRVVRVPMLKEAEAGGRYIAPDLITVRSLDGAAILVERTHTWAIDGVARAGATSIIGNVIR